MSITAIIGVILALFGLLLWLAFGNHLVGILLLAIGAFLFVVGFFGGRYYRGGL